MNPCKFHGSTSLGTFGVICWELDGTVRRWMARVHESSQMNDAKSKYLRRTVKDADIDVQLPNVTYTILIYSCPFGPQELPTCAVISKGLSQWWSFHSMKFWHRHGADRTEAMAAMGQRSWEITITVVMNAMVVSSRVALVVAVMGRSPMTMRRPGNFRCLRKFGFGRWK